MHPLQSYKQLRIQYIMNNKFKQYNFTHSVFYQADKSWQISRWWTTINLRKYCGVESDGATLLFSWRLPVDFPLKSR